MFLATYACYVAFAVLLLYRASRLLPADAVSLSLHHTFIHLSIGRSVRLPSVSISPFIYLLFRSFYPPIHPSIHRFIYPFVHASIRALTRCLSFPHHFLPLSDCTEWSKWGTCSVTCGQGTHSRSRLCCDGSSSGLYRDYDRQSCDSGQACPNTGKYQVEITPNISLVSASACLLCILCVHSAPSLSSVSSVRPSVCGLSICPCVNPFVCPPVVCLYVCLP